VLIYFDSNIVIYAVENPPVFGPKTHARLQALNKQDRIGVSELTRMECCSFPLRQSNFSLLRLFDSFFTRPDVSVLPITTNVLPWRESSSRGKGFQTCPDGLGKPSYLKNFLAGVIA
jgi:predicted nucleic acid-binding protein